MKVLIALIMMLAPVPAFCDEETSVTADNAAPIAALTTALTPVLFVDRIETSLPFFEAIGFKVSDTVPAEDGLGFAILGDGVSTVMFQTWKSLEADNALQSRVAGGDKSFLFVSVTDLNAIIAALPGATIYMPRRQTFYGSDEIGFIEPGGHYVTFAEFAAPSD